MSIRVAISRSYTRGPEGEEEYCDVDEWSIEVDVAYSPDVVDDLQRRVVAMRAADRAELNRSLRADE